MQVRIAASVYMDVTTNQMWLVNDEDSNKRIRVYRLMGSVDTLDDISGANDDYEASGGTEAIEEDDAPTHAEWKAARQAKKETNPYGVTARIYKMNKDNIKRVLAVMEDDPGNALTSYEINNRLGTPMSNHVARARVGCALSYLAESGYINKSVTGTRHYMYSLREDHGSSNKDE